MKTALTISVEYVEKSHGNLGKRHAEEQWYTVLVGRRVTKSQMKVW